jgi:CHAT domain-containing protein
VGGGGTAASGEHPKKKEREIASEPLPEAPEDFLRTLSTPGSPAWTRLRLRSEELIDVALSSWLPQSTSAQGTVRETYLRALDSLAQILADVHHDLWLRDLLSSASNPQAKQGFAALSLALAAAYSLEQQLRGLEYRWIEAQLALEEAICQGMIGNFEVGREALDRAVAIAEASNYGVLGLRALGMRASYYTDAGNTADAWSNDMEGLVRYWDGRYPHQRAFQFYSDLAISAQKRSRWHLAAMLQREAASMISRTPNRSVEAMAWNRYGAFAEMAGMSLEAEAAFRRADALFDSLPGGKANRLYRLDCELNRAMTETARGGLEKPLERLAAIQAQIPLIDDYTVRKHFYQTLGTLQLRRGAFAASKAAFETALQLSRASLPSFKNDRERLAWEQDAAVIYRGLVDVLFRGQHDPKTAQAQWKSYHELLFAAGKRDRVKGIHRPFSRRRQSHPGNHVLRDISVITYAQLPDGIVIWLTDAQSKVTARWVDAKEPDLNLLARRFTAECSNPSAPLARLQEDGRSLYQLLIAPVAGSIGQTTLLVIETDGILTDVPMQALVDNAGNFLGLEHAMVVSQGTGAHVPSWHSDGVRAHIRTLVVGDPLLDASLAPSFPPLPNARQEAEFVSGLFPGSQLLIRKDATPQAVKQGLTQTELFHFAGHAVFTPSGGRLLLAGPSAANALDYQDLEQVHCQRCQLAVISSCSTETGEDDIINPDGLARAFLVSGVTEVVASRWSVDSSATQSFMEKFYQSLLSGSSVPAALQVASIRIKGQPATSHPYYWAAFNVYVGGSGIEVLR